MKYTHKTEGRDSIDMAPGQGKPEDDWSRKIRLKMEEELERRVREALDTPPLERMKRNQRANLKSKEANHEGLNSHIDLMSDGPDSASARVLRMRSHTQRGFEDNQLVADDLTATDEGNGNGEIEDPASQVAEYFLARHHQGVTPYNRPPPFPFECVDSAEERRESGPSYPPGCGPLLPAPVFKDVVYQAREPLYTSVAPVLGGTTFESQVTPYTHKWRGICIAFDSEKSLKYQHPMKISNPLVAPTLMFESRFECGNLRQARRVGQFEYELVLKTDVFTKRHTQWYYFRVQNMLPGITYKFRIINLLKRDSLYNHGMRPLMYSETDANTNNKGWMRVGHHINYGRNIQHMQCSLLHREIPYYVQEWQVEFPHGADDTVYFSHCYPYTYTDLKRHIDRLMNDAARSQWVTREVLCETRAGNACFLLTVTDVDVKNNLKKGVVLSARVHPGESNASWMMKGLIDFITSSHSTAQALRKLYVFKIVPMVNPDGVIIGNYRCSLAARDLNRNYRKPRRESFPTVWHIKSVVEALQQKMEVVVYCDFHGHSRKYNVFMYGNDSPDASQGNVKSYLNDRLFPFLISKEAPEAFSFQSCKFQIRRCKESTGRVVMYRQMNIKNSFTLEATFSGTLLDKEGPRHFNQTDFESIGKYFCMGLLRYHESIYNEDKEAEAVLDLTKNITQQILAMKGVDIPAGEALPTRENTLLLDNITNDIDSLKSRSAEQPVQDVIGDVFDSRIKERLQDDSGSRRDAVLSSIDTMVGQTVDSCLSLLQRLNVSQRPFESDSSDSDSESEPEMKEKSSNKKKKKKSKKKKDAARKHVKPSFAKLVSSASASNGGGAGDDHRLDTTGSSFGDGVRNAYRTLPAISQDQTDDAKKGKAAADRLHRMARATPWSNPYSGRTNGGIPCFSEERSLERAARKVNEIQKRMDERDVKGGVLWADEFRERLEYMPPGGGGPDGQPSYYRDLMSLSEKAREDIINKSINSIAQTYGVHAYQHSEKTRVLPAGQFTYMGSVPYPHHIGDAIANGGIISAKESSAQRRSEPNIANTTLGNIADLLVSQPRGVPFSSLHSPYSKNLPQCVENAVRDAFTAASKPATVAATKTAPSATRSAPKHVPSTGDEPCDDPPENGTFGNSASLHDRGKEDLRKGSSSSSGGKDRTPAAPTTDAPHNKPPPPSNHVSSFQNQSQTRSVQQSEKRSRHKNSMRHSADGLFIPEQYPFSFERDDYLVHPAREARWYRPPEVYHHHTLGETPLAGPDSNSIIGFQSHALRRHSDAVNKFGTSGAGSSSVLEKRTLQSRYDDLVRAHQQNQVQHGHHHHPPHPRGERPAVLPAGNQQRRVTFMTKDYTEMLSQQLSHGGPSSGILNRQGSQSHLKKLLHINPLTQCQEVDE